MKRYLENEKHLKFKDINGEFVIREIVGRGASCVVYRADFYNEFGRVSEHLLKEYNPKDINMCRDDEACLLVNSESDMKRFEQGLNNFIEGYKKQELLRRNAELKNYTANVQNLYEGYGTIFIDMNVTEGMSYANVTEKSLYNLAKRMKVLAQVVGEYHRNGYLHLDLKPNNIYVRPEKETCEDVLLFDFDSLAKKEDIGKGTRVSYTNAWAPLELTSSSRRGLICEATDIFSLGEIFFEKLMGRHSGIRERRSFSKYEYDFKSDILKNVNPKVTVLLDELFRKTLCNTVGERYQSVDCLVNKFDEIIQISNHNEPYLKSSCPEPQEFFVGRDNELRDIHSLLMDSKILFLSGMGGIGKSELAKNYAKIYKDYYDVVVFVPYVSNLISAFGSDEVFPINNVFKYPEEKMDEYCKRKFRKIKELCDERTLIIVDNFDLTEDDMLEEILKFNCKILFTTRMDFSEYNRAQKVIDAIEDKNVQMDIFKKYYTKELSDTDKLYVKEIIEIVAGHTMTIELLAKQMMAGRVKPDKMLKRLKEIGISDAGKEKVAISKDDNFRRGSAYEHIKILFDITKLNNEDIYILENLTFIPYTGIYTDKFCEWCEIGGYDNINNLINSGWIKINKYEDVISLHPLISEVIQGNVLNYEEISKCLLANSMSLRINKLETKNREKYISIIMNILYIIINKKIESIEAARFIRITVSNAIVSSIIGSNDTYNYIKYALNIYINKFGEKSEMVVMTYIVMAETMVEEGMYLDAEKMSNKAINIMKDMAGTEENAYQEYEGYRKAKRVLARIYYHQYLFDKAEEIIIKDINYYELKKSKMSFPGKVILAKCYSEKKEYEKAIKIYESILDELSSCRTSWGDKSIRASMYYGLAQCYSWLKNADKSNYHIGNAMAIWNEIYVKGDIHTALANEIQGMNCMIKKDYFAAEEYLLKTCEIKEKSGTKSGIRNTYKLICELYEKMGRYEESLFYANLCFEFTREILGDEDERTKKANNRAEYIKSILDQNVDEVKN